MPSDLTTPETEAPERISVFPAYRDRHGGHPAEVASLGFPGTTLYIRADLHEAALSAARREAEEARERALDVACEIAERIRREKREDPSEWQAGRLRGALDVADALAAYREAGEGRANG